MGLGGAAPVQPLALAAPTLRPAARADVCVAELVAALTVRFSDVIRARGNAALDVLKVRHRLKVFRIAARAVAAQVVKIKPLGNRTDNRLINMAMRHDAPPDRRTTKSFNQDVAERARLGVPRPTSIRPVLLPKASHSFYDGYVFHMPLNIVSLRQVCYRTL